MTLFSYILIYFHSYDVKLFIKLFIIYCCNSHFNNCEYYNNNFGILTQQHVCSVVFPQLVYSTVSISASGHGQYIPLVGT